MASSPPPPAPPPFECSALPGAPETARNYLPHSDSSGFALAVLQQGTTNLPDDVLACHGTQSGSFSRIIQRPFPENREHWAALISDGVLYLSGGELRASDGGQQTPRAFKDDLWSLDLNQACSTTDPPLQLTQVSSSAGYGARGFHAIAPVHDKYVMAGGCEAHWLGGCLYKDDLQISTSLSSWSGATTYTPFGSDRAAMTRIAATPGRSGFCDMSFVIQRGHVNVPGNGYSNDYSLHVCCEPPGESLSCQSLFDGMSDLTGGWSASPSILTYDYSGRYYKQLQWRTDESAAWGTTYNMTDEYPPNQPNETCVAITTSFMYKQLNGGLCAASIASSTASSPLLPPSPAVPPRLPPVPPPESPLQLPQSPPPLVPPPSLPQLPQSPPPLVPPPSLPPQRPPPDAPPALPPPSAPPAYPSDTPQAPPPPPASPPPASPSPASPPPASPPPVPSAPRPPQEPPCAPPPPSPPQSPPLLPPQQGAGPPSSAAPPSQPNETLAGGQDSISDGGGGGGGVIAVVAAVLVPLLLCAVAVAAGVRCGIRPVFVYRSSTVRLPASTRRPGTGRRRRPTGRIGAEGGRPDSASAGGHHDRPGGAADWGAADWGGADQKAAATEVERSGDAGARGEAP